jgi:DNA (cytosine-5)-methyltransferase 1
LLKNPEVAEQLNSKIASQGDSGRELTVGSLFAGIGGFCLAFKNAGFRILWANENDPFATETYRHNFGEVKLFTHSIRDLSVVRDNLDEVDVLTAGFPCQPFSVAGTKQGFNDPRGKLFFEITRLIRELGRKKPKLLVLENVRNLLDHNGGKSFAKVIEEIQTAGYWFHRKNLAILNTKEHTDIPQNRERIYMVAFSWDHFDTSNFNFPEPVEAKRGVREFLDLDKKASEELYFPEDSKYGRMFIESMQKGNPDSAYLLRRFYVRENKNDEVFTLTANMGDGGHNKPVIRDAWGIRSLTPEECLRLQGFPTDSYSFPSSVSRTQRYKQIGNAVTVSLVEKIAAECAKQLLDRRP